MKILFIADKNSIEFKDELKEYLNDTSYEIVDKSVRGEECFIRKITDNCQDIIDEKYDKTILIDESGTVPFIVASKHKRIICAQVADEHTAKMTRDHNNTSVISIGSSVTGIEVAKKICSKFIESEYSGGRHQIRIDMLNKML